MVTTDTSAVGKRVALPLGNAFVLPMLVQVMSKSALSHNESDAKNDTIQSSPNKLNFLVTEDHIGPSELRALGLFSFTFSLDDACLTP